MQRLTRNDRRELRLFALGLALILLAVFWWFFPWLRERPQPLWPLVIAGVLVTMAWVWPPGILAVHRAFLPLARVLAFINTWVLLGAVFFAILLPLGWVLRRLGKLQYTMGFDAAAASYRVPVAADHETRLKDPF
jgi:hypothetical protein